MHQENQQETVEANSGESWVTSIRDAWSAILAMASEAMHKWKRVTVIWAGLTLLLLAVMLLLPNKYAARATLLPPIGGAASGLSSSLLPNLSLSDFSLSGDSNMDYYPQIVKSDLVINEVLASPWKDSSLVLDFYTGGSEASERNMELIRRTVRSNILVDEDQKTGSITLRFTSENADFSSLMLELLVSNLEDYLNTQIKTNARLQRQQVETRLQQVADSLREAEDLIEAFRSTNRSFSDSPKLTIEYGRLQRRLEILNTVFIELNKQHELIKIKEVGEQPLLNVLDRPVPPVLRSSPPSRAKTMIAGFIAFFLFAVLWVHYEGAIYSLHRQALERISEDKKDSTGDQDE